MESVNLVENKNGIKIQIGENKNLNDKSSTHGANLLGEDEDEELKKLIKISLDKRKDKGTEKGVEMDAESEEMGEGAGDSDSEEEWEELDESLSGGRKWLDRHHRALVTLLDSHSATLKRLCLLLCGLAYVLYFVYALRHNYRDEGALILIVGTCFFILYHVHTLLKRFVFAKASKAFRPFRRRLSEHSSAINTVALLCIYASVGVVVGMDVGWGRGGPYNLVSVTGLVVYVGMVTVCSCSPARIRWRTVAWGFGLQLLFAIFIVRWQHGYHVLKWIGDRVTDFLSFADVGCEFVFGPNFRDHLFAMKILPTIIFISSTISILFHLGAMQWMIVRISSVMEALMETTSGESFSAASNIFIGMSETPLAIKPLLPCMTDSELHAVMTSGFATIAGSCMAAYIGFGVSANHLLSASVMSAPAALAISKLLCPETKKTKTSSGQVKAFLRERSERSVVDAAAAGAASAVTLAAMVAANLLAFVSLLAVVNSALEWLGRRVGMLKRLSFQLICSYVFWPLALVMGVEVEDCRRVAQLIGVKTFVNEFVAYLELKELLDNRKLLDGHVASNGSWSWIGDDILLQRSNLTHHTLIGGVIDDRSATISTYALCGFSNFGSIGITIGVFTALLPRKRPRLASLVMSSMIAGNIACFVTACVAGLFYSPER